MGSQEIVASSNGESHQPVFEGRLGTKGVQFLKGFNEDFLGDVFDFALATGVFSGGGENPGLILRDQCFKTLRISLDHSLNECLFVTCRAVGWGAHSEFVQKPAEGHGRPRELALGDDTGAPPQGVRGGQERDSPMDQGVIDAVRCELKRHLYFPDQTDFSLVQQHYLEFPCLAGGAALIFRAFWDPSWASHSNKVPGCGGKVTARWGGDF